MAHTQQMSIMQRPDGRGVTAMNGWTDLQLSQARARAARLGIEAAEERFAREVALARVARPSFRMRIEGAVAGWRRPEKVLAG